MCTYFKNPLKLVQQNIMMGYITPAVIKIKQINENIINPK